MTEPCQFLPEYSFVPTRGGYRPAYRLFVGKPLHMVPGSEPLPTAGQAVAAAMDYVRERINSKIEAEQIEVEAELSEFDAWKRRKADQERAERHRVFGPQAIIRDCAGNEVKVETRRRVRV